MTNVMTNESLQKDQVGLVLEEIQWKTADVVLVQQTEKYSTDDDEDNGDDDDVVLVQ